MPPMHRPLALFTLLLPLAVTAVPPPQPGMPEGALLGLEEDAAALAAARAATLEPAPGDVAASPGAALPRPAGATRVLLPLHLRLPFLRRLLLEQVYTEEGRARFKGDEGGCSELDLSDPRLHVQPAGDSEPALLVTVLQMQVRVGLPVGSGCGELGRWRGQLELEQFPGLLAGGGGFTLGLVEASLDDGEGNRAAAGALWALLEARVMDALGVLRVDLREPVEALRELLPLVLARQTADGLAAVLSSLRVDDARAEPGGLVVDLEFRAPPAPPSVRPARLDADELERFRQAVSQLDGFLTFVVRTVAGEALAPASRDALLAALLDGRYRLLEALAEGVPGDAEVRDLFVELWTGLAPVLEELPAAVPREAGLRYLAFITAGDLLAALEALGPGTGLDISADGLRRLARLLAPRYEGDPLGTGEGVDEALRQRFGFDAPLPLPPLVDEPDAGLGLLDWLLPPARAGEDAAVDAAALSALLQDRVPRAADLDDYLELVRDLLHAVVEAELAASAVDSVLAHPSPGSLILATAWQESCWRQFVVESGAVVTLRSPAGALGVMQVNRHVWRGFYDVDGLARDFGYNARAGAEIARHYLLDHALRAGEDGLPGGLDNLARATYAAYNGGPGQLGRYRQAATPARLRNIDRTFLDRYERIRSGDELAVRECYGG